ncbi:ubiquinone anaerobic biosynthesis accessory factor UbiT [Aliikangiella coralliicola]|nr:SCP2 sterol-binding domain-containing protein [Aliikangiella coralliicola]
MALNTNLVSKLCNRIFDEQIHEGDFDILKNRTVQISFSDANLSIAFSFDNNKIHCKHFSEIKNSADADLSIITADAIRLIKQEVDPDTLFFQRRLKISGDTELAHHIKNTVDTLNPELIPPVIMKLISDYQSRILVD